jgi:hypothetical protein
MKYWNKDKEIRKRCWTQVTLTQRKARSVLPNGAHAWFPEFYDDAEIKQWCQRQKSTGKFYNYHASQVWWFEHPQDATWVALKWA